jgi:hypothetical protein
MTTATTIGRFGGLRAFSASVVLAGVGMAFGVGCGAGPDAALKEWNAAVKAKDGAKCWTLLSASSKAAFDKLAASLKGGDKEMAAGFGVTEAEMKALDGKTLFGGGLKSPAGPVVEVPEAALESVKVEGDKATPMLKGGIPGPLTLVKEEGAWKVALSIPEFPTIPKMPEMPKMPDMPKVPGLPGAGGAGAESETEPPAKK